MTKRDGLTPAQTEVARLLHEGYSRSEIANLLDISENTVSQHIFKGARRIGGRGRPIVVLVRHYGRLLCRSERLAA